MVDQWLIRFIDADAPAGAALENASVALRGQFPWWLAILVWVLAAAGIIWLYFREASDVVRFRRAMMAALRIAAVGVLLLMLLRPVLTGQYVGQRPRDIVLLVDDSRSMAQADPRTTPESRLRAAIAADLVPPNATNVETAGLSAPSWKNVENSTRSELVGHVLGNPRLKLLERLRRSGPVCPLLFGGQMLAVINEQSPREPISGRDLAKQLKAEESRTALADAVSECLSRGSDLPAAIVAVTDGRDNASRRTLNEVAQDCAELGVPLHIYGVGGTQQPELQIKELDVGRTLFFDDEVSVPVAWRAQGITSGTVEVSLMLGEQVVASQELPAATGEDLRETLTFVPRKSAGLSEKIDVVASVRVKDGPELAHQVRRRVKLLDRRIKVLYIENVPRWQYKYLQTTLLRDRRVEADFLLAAGDRDVLHSGPPYVPTMPSREQLFTYDVIILGNVPSDFLGAQHLASIRDFVDQGGGLLLIAGREHMPANYRNGPLAEGIPVECPPAKYPPLHETRPVAFLPMLTEAGRKSEMLAFAEEEAASFNVWEEFPGWYWHHPVTKLRPGAVSLLAHPTEKADDEPMPLLAIHTYGTGPVLFVAGDESWRWRYNASEEKFARFWGQVVYKLGMPHVVQGSPRAQLALEHPRPEVGRPSTVYARLFDEVYHPLDEPRVEGLLEKIAPGTNEQAIHEVVLEAVPGRPGEYRATLANDSAGQFEL
ncbi:MAG: hypothetical protein O3A00_23425, partial [Planctomycetota bacterium]|nr:hypothetical protein [Planctomycetota bacterium]